MRADDAQTIAGGLDVEQGLDLETCTVDVEMRQARAPERVIAVAKVGELHAPHAIDEGAERSVAGAPHTGASKLVEVRERLAAPDWFRFEGGLE